jgi:AraC family transcriptional regulator
VAVARTVAGIQVERKRFGPGGELAWHHHRGAYGCVVLRGSAHEQLGSEMHELKSMDGTVRRPGIGHGARFGRSGADVVSFEVDPGRLQALNARGWKRRDLVRRRSALLGALGRRVAVELRESDHCSALVLEGLVLELFGEILRVEPFAPGSLPAWLKRVRDRLHDEPERRHTHEELAREAAVHPVHLAQMFRRFFGQPPAAYQRRLRLEHAAQRLARTDDTLAEIALASGYCDQAHFSNAFKREVGLTPAAYRRLFSPKGVQET